MSGNLPFRFRDIPAANDPEKNASRSLHSAPGKASCLPLDKHKKGHDQRSSRHKNNVPGNHTTKRQAHSWNGAWKDENNVNPRQKRIGILLPPDIFFRFVLHPLSGVPNLTYNRFAGNPPTTSGEKHTMLPFFLGSPGRGTQAATPNVRRNFSAFIA